MNSNIQGYNIKLPIIPDALQAMSKNPSAIKFTSKNSFENFLEQQKYFNASYSHCYYSKEDYELSHKGDSRFREKNTGVSEANRGCVLKKNSGDLVAIWDEKNQIGYIEPSNLQENKKTKNMKITLSEVKQIIKEEVDRYKKIKLLEAKKASIEKELDEFLKEIEEKEVEEGIGMSLTNKKGMNAKPNAPYFKPEEEMEEGAGISKTVERGQNKKPETPHKKERY